MALNLARVNYRNILFVRIFHILFVSCKLGFLLNFGTMTVKLKSAKIKICQYSVFSIFTLISKMSEENCAILRKLPTFDTAK